MAKFGQKSVAQRLREIEELVEEKGIEEAGRIAEERNLLPTASERKQAEKIQAQKAQSQTIQNVNNARNQNLVLPTARKNNTYLQLTGSLQKKANDYVNSSKYAERKAKEEKEKLVKELKEKRYELEKEYKETTDWLSNVGGQGKYLAAEKYAENEQKAEALKKEIDLLSKDIDNHSDITIDNKIKYGTNLVAKSFVDGGERLADFLVGNIGTAVTTTQKVLGADEQVVDKTRNAFETLANVDVAGAGFDKVLERNAKIAGIDQNAMPSKLAYGIGTNVFDLATSVGTGGASIYGSVGGGHLQESLQDGATLEQATVKADVIGAVIGKLEGVFNKTFGVTGNSALSKVASKSKTVSKFINDLSKTGAGKSALKFISEALEGTSEIGEEFAEEILDDVTTKIIYDRTREIGVTSDEAKEIAIMTALSTFALRGVTGQSLTNTEINEAIEISKKYIDENKISTEKLPVAREESKNIAKQDAKIEENASNIAQDAQVQQEIMPNTNIAPYNNEKYVAEDVKAKMQQVVDSTNKISKSDVKLEFTKLDGNIKAQTDGNTIKIDISKASLGDVIHEITHNTETSKGYLAVSDYILTELDKRGELQSIKEEMNTLYSSIYEQEGRTFTEKDLENEIVANYTEKFANDEAFVNKITQTDRNFAQKIYDWIKEKVNYYRTVSNMTDEQRAQYDELKRAEKLWMKALKENNNESLSNNKYKILENNKGKYVKADRQVITGKNPQVWKKQTENYINEQIRKGKDVIFYSEDGTPLTISKNTAGKATFRNDVKTKENTYRKMTDEEFKRKLQAEVHIDELSQISKHKSGPVPDTKNHTFAKDGFSYRTAYFEDEDGQYYRVTMSVGQNGEINTIYNIGKMDKKNRSNPSLTAQRPSRNKSTEVTPSINSIASENKDVNTTNNNYMQKAKDNTLSTAKNNKAPKYSIAGQKGMNNAINNDYRNKKLEEMYNKALSMSKVGVNNETIRKTTNWYQDKNGDWKFEFSDKDMSLKNIEFHENKTYKLGDILEHDTLFMLYPELANYDVEFTNMKSTGRYSKITKQIKLNKKLLNRKQSTEGTLIHEIQHAIQDIEGFEIGTNTLFKEAYYNNLGEIEATDTKQRLINERKGKLNRYEVAPESSKTLPKHQKYDNYIKNRKLVDKIKDGVYNYFNEKVNKNEKNIKENGRYNYDTDSKIVLQDRENINRQTRNRLGSQRGGYVDNTLATVKNNKAPKYSVKENEGKERKHYKSIVTSEMVAKPGKEVAKNLLEKDRYIPTSNKKQLEFAEDRIKTSGISGTLESFREKLNSGKRLTPDDLALGERLIQEYSNSQDIDTLNQLIQDVAIIGTELGQSVQALSLIHKMTPEGQLMTLQKSINRINTAEKLDIKLTKEQTEKIVNAKGEAELNKALAEVSEEIAEQIPVKATDKLRSWRYLSMLGNPRTHIRNILSNVAMKGTMGVKNKVAGAIEDIINPAERTRTFKKATREAREFATNDAESMVDRIANGGKYDVNTLINQNKKQFDSRIMNTIADFNSNALEIEDKIFIKSAYKEALANYMTANKLTPEYLQSGTKEANIALTKAREFASYEAQVATFRQFSWLATKINQIENKNTATKVLMGGLLPFKKTPINIAKTGIEYSPVGLAKTLTKNSIDLKKGNITANQYIDNISKGLTGTSISILGYVLAQAGILKGSSGDDDREATYSSGAGNQEYAIKIGDKTFTIDWISPSAMPLLVGAEFYNSAKEDESTINATIGTMTKTLNPLVEMSMLQSFVSTLQSFSQGELDSLADMGMNMAESYAGQYVPTILGQTARVIDDTERNTYYTDKKAWEARMVRFFNKQIAKIPFASKTLQPKVDVWGDEVKREDNIAIRAVNQYLNPSYVKTIRNTEADKAVQKLYKASEDSSVLPKAFNSKFNMDSENKVLTPEENTKYAKKYGKAIKNNITQVANTREYNSLPTADRVNTIKAIYSDSNDKIKGIYADEHNIDYKATDDVDSAIKDGLSLSNAYIYRGNVNSIQSEKDKSGETIAGSKSGNKAKYIMKLPTADEQKNLMLGLVSDSEIKPTVDALKTIGEKNYNTYFSISNSKSRAKYVGLAGTGMNSNSLNNYIDTISSLEADKDENGNSIRNSLKNKKYEYINSLNLTANEKKLLFAKDYEPSESDKAEIISYINGLNIDVDDKYELLKQLKGVETDKYGNISW